MWTRLLRPAPDHDGVSDTVLTLTAIILLLRPLDVWWLAPFALAIACLALAVRAIRRAPLTWLVVAALVAARVAVVWPLSDNHIYLLAYWCLALGLALARNGSAATLSSSSRWLIGASFAMAVLWKAVLSPDYTDGRFFRVTLLTDQRFADAALVFGGLSRDQMAANRAVLEPLPEGAELLDPPPVAEPPRLRAFAAAATWGGLLLEALVAFAFLLPAGGRLELARARDAARLLHRHLRLGARGRVRLAARHDRARALPPAPAVRTRPLPGGVRADPPVYGVSLEGGAGRLGGRLTSRHCREGWRLPRAGRNTGQLAFRS